MSQPCATLVGLPSCPDPDSFQAAPLLAVLDNSDHQPYLATVLTMEADTKRSAEYTSDNTESSTTRPSADSELESPKRLTTLVSPAPRSVDDMASLPSVVTHPSSRETPLNEYMRSIANGLKTPEPVPSFTPDARTLPLMEHLDRRSSPSLSGQHSGVSTHLMTPQSSPRTECSSITVESQTRDGVAGSTNDHAHTCDYTTIIMSSPTLALDRDDPASPSPSQQATTSCKRATYNDSDELVKRVRLYESRSSRQGSPAPRRATLKSQKLSRKKLAAPFRSPLRTKTTPVHVVPSTSDGEVIQEQIIKESQVNSRAAPNAVQGVCTGATKPIKTLFLSSRASTQFRSPLMKPPADLSRPVVLPNQAIMNLERRLTVLRRAIKFKRDGDDRHLEGLVRKWRDAGREAAYELWSIVRDISTEGGEIRGNTSDIGWGWDDQDRDRDEGMFEGGLSEEKQESPLGVMLRKLGIAPETLGWDDEEETFVDVDDE
ncbi:hypothetical protein B0F90DRAFT_564613 [Multifurca ochricompacta]|uniref:Swi5-dependent recombination DNA repair protein 1 n=1 Tax=Multifurca ochricompacta TaxID=376703 RepID=A0AAD4QR69_9AGAM|nr:hypothetical protein B0F90DRAFT_564613 [Multifurca ochricompacta]